MKKRAILTCISLAACLFFISNCKKETFERTNSSTAEIVKSTISGQVLDNYGKPLPDATVVMEGATTTTDRYGVFIFKNIKTPSDRAIVKVTATGFFDGFRTLSVRKGGFYSTKIKLVEQAIALNFTASNGGQVSFGGQLFLDFPKDAIAKNGAAYSGLVQVKAGIIDPDDPYVPQMVSGALRGIDNSGIEKLLFTKGMFMVELTGGSGEKLEIAAGKKVSFTFDPLNLGNSPATIPMWHFDETEGLWREEGTASYSNGQYTGTVSHFSTWNLDVPTTMVRVKFRLVDSATGEPLRLKNLILNASNQGYGYAQTDGDGVFDDFVPADQILGLDIDMGVYQCFFQQDFSTQIGPFSAETSVDDDIILDLQDNGPAAAKISGRLVDCNGKPVAFGGVYLIFDFGGDPDPSNGQEFIPTDENGNFSAIFPTCGPQIPPIGLQGIDYQAETKSILKAFNIENSQLAIADLNACELKNSFVNFTLDGKKYELVGNQTWSTEKVVTGFEPGDTTFFYMSFVKASGFNSPGNYPIDYILAGDFQTNDVSNIHINHEVTKWEAEVLMFGKFSGTVRDSMQKDHEIEGNYEIFKY